MYAIIQTGGKQYRVTEGQTLQLESLPAKVGDSISFDEVLMVVEGEQRHIGTPRVPQATVTAEVLAHARAPKVEIIKFKRRKHHMKHQGHRQNYTSVKITGISRGSHGS